MKLDALLNYIFGNKLLKKKMFYFSTFMKRLIYVEMLVK